MDTQLSFRFRAPEDRLPAPLPTVADITSSQGPDILDDRHSGVKVVRVNSHFAIKYGRLVDFLEGENMVFVRKSTKIRVPELYAMFTEVSTDIRFIVMEYIPGKTLSSCWKALDNDQKQLITKQLRHYLDELRSLPSPNPSYFGSLDGSGLRHVFFGAVDGNKTFCGPFETEDGIVQALVDKARYTRRTCDPVYEQANFMEAALLDVFRGHEAVFTHGDLHRRNIIIQGDGAVAVIDWAWAGWYPSFWEYGNAIWACLGFEDDWHAWVGKILECFYAEWAWFNLIYENQHM